MGGFLNPALSALGMSGADNQQPQQPGQIPSVYVPPPPQSQQTLELPQVYKPDASTLEIPSHAPAGPRPPSPPGGTLPFQPRPELLQAMRTQESGGVQDPSTARGKAGEVGRMQVLPQTAAMYGVSPEQLRRNPQLADTVGERYYTDLLRRYHGNEFLALVAYNSGPGRVDRGQLLPQSIRYATQILKRVPTGGAQTAAPQGPQLTPPGPQSLPSMMTGMPQPPQAVPDQGQVPPQIPGQAPQPPQPQAPPSQPQQQPPEGAPALQQMLAGQGPESMYGPLGMEPPEAMLAGETSPRAIRQMTNLATGPEVPAIEAGIEDIPALSGAARAMVRRARAFGIDPEQIGPLAQRVREGTLTERGLSQALQGLRRELPQTAKTAAMIRGAAEDIPRDVLGAISRAVREGDLTAQQAKKMLKAVTGGAALLPLLGAERQPEERQPATPSTPQPGAVGQVPLQVQQQPGMLQRVGQALGGALEGTAYAGEPSGGFDFSGFPRTGGAAATPAAATAPAAAPSGPPPGVTINPLTGGMTMGQPGGQLPSTDPVERSSTLSITGTGMPSFRMTQRTKPPSAQEQQEYDSAMDAIARTKDALKFWDDHIAKRVAAGEFKGGPTTRGGRHRINQSLTYKYPLFFGTFEDYTDPEIDFFFSKLGPLQAEQLRANVGGRLGIGMAHFLGPHIPDPQRMDIMTIKARLDALRVNIPIFLQTYRELHGLGWSNDQIGEYLSKISTPDPFAKQPATATTPTPTPAAAATPTARAAGGDEPPPGSGYVRSPHTGRWYNPSTRQWWK